MSIFTKVAMRKPPYSTFDLSHQVKLSCNMGELIPILVQECVPGDKFTHQTAQLVRFAPMLAPVMHQVSVYTHSFFVPNRVLWPNWEDFINGPESPSDISEPVFPTITMSGLNVIGSLSDYIGLPQNVDGGSREVSAMPFSAYQYIYNEYFRDQNLITERLYKLEDGDNAASKASLTSLRQRAWQHDYFTSALPFTQKGPQATIPLGTSAPLTLDETAGNTVFRDSLGAIVAGANTPPNLANSGILFNGAAPGQNMYADVTANTTADLSQATAASITDLRRAFRLQEWLEKNARAGTRYNELILSHFGVSIGDARLDRPEFLGGGSVPIQFSEVLQTSSTDATTPQANMAGHGISAGQNSKYSYRCREHGFIITIMSIMPKTSYQQGLPKHFKKFDKFDYYWPSFAHIGEQPILNEEIYLADGDDGDTFGYTPRYAEYKFTNDRVCGEFKATLDFWHIGRIFSTRPVLNQAFIECVPDTRIFANEVGEQMYVHIYHQIKAKRPMPYFGVPTI